MPEAFGNFYNSFFTYTDILYQYFNCILSIFVNHLEFLSKIVEYLTIRTIAIHWKEVYFVSSTKRVYFYLFFKRSFSRNDDLIVFEVLKIVRFIIKFRHLHVMIQLLQFKKWTLKPWFSYIWIFQEKLTTEIRIGDTFVIPNRKLSTPTKHNILSYFNTQWAKSQQQYSSFTLLSYSLDSHCTNIPAPSIFYFLIIDIQLHQLPWRSFLSIADVNLLYL